MKTEWTPESRWRARFPEPESGPLKAAGEVFWRWQRREYPNLAKQLTRDSGMLRKNALVEYRCGDAGCLLAAVVKIDGRDYWLVHQEVTPVALSAYDVADVVQIATEGTEWLASLLADPKSVVGVPAPVDDSALQVLADWLVGQLAAGEVTAVDHIPESVSQALKVMSRGGAYRSRGSLRCIDATHLADWEEFRLLTCAHRDRRVDLDEVLTDVKRLTKKRRKRVVHIDAVQPNATQG